MANEGKKSWYLAQGGAKQGPFTSQELQQMGAEGGITSDMMVWRDGMDTWQPVSKVRGLTVTTITRDPPPAPQAPAVTVAITPSPAAAPMPVKGHVTIERTAKSLKLQQLMGLACIVLGLVLVAAGASTEPEGSKEVSGSMLAGGMLFLVGLAWRLVTRMRIWWNHG